MIVLICVLWQAVEIFGWDRIIYCTLNVPQTMSEASAWTKRSPLGLNCVLNTVIEDDVHLLIRMRWFTECTVQSACARFTVLLLQ